MSWRGLRYKGVEFIYPEEWNAIIDALNDLRARVKGGLATFTGDGVTTIFAVTHGLGATPETVSVTKASKNTPDIDYVYADADAIYIVFKTPPASGTTVSVYWLAIKPLPG
jgi:hypothetical protein